MLASGYALLAACVLLGCSEGDRAGFLHDTELGEYLCRAAAAQQWDRGDWAEPGPITPGSRRPSDSSLPLHEAWMQHEAGWAQLNRVRVCSTITSVRLVSSFKFLAIVPYIYCTTMPWEHSDRRLYRRLPHAG